MLAVVLAGLALGVLSRVEELEAGFFVGISTHATWALAPYLAGVLASSAPRGALRGAVLLTCANAGYYAWSAAARPGVPLDSVAGSVPHWFAAGLGAGAVFGALGAVTRHGTAPLRIAAAVTTLTVIAADAAGAFGALLP